MAEIVASSDIEDFDEDEDMLFDFISKADQIFSKAWVLSKINNEPIPDILERLAGRLVVNVKQLLSERSSEIYHRFCIKMAETDFCDRSGWYDPTGGRVLYQGVFDEETYNRCIRNLDE
jgi:hypothetical protein